MSFLSEYRTVQQLLKEEQEIVFYSESANYYVYYQALILELVNQGFRITYITSDKNDPLLTNDAVQMRVVYVKWMLGFLFPRIRAKMVIMTMPDLDNFLFKRSPLCETYPYIFHAAVSTHQQYRKEAFFHYDAICCTGEYQLREIRTAEERYGNAAKELIPFGYPLFHQLRERKIVADEKTILIAPSWFSGCIFDTCVTEMVTELARTDFKIIIRPHPEYSKRDKKGFRNLMSIAAKHSSISLDNDPDVLNSISKAGILITDRSGIALEFAFGKQRPVLFVDTSLKTSNPSYSDLGIEPLENSIRSQIGISIAPTAMHELPSALQQLKQMSTDFPTRMARLEEEIFFDMKEGMGNALAFIRAKLNR